MATLIIAGSHRQFLEWMHNQGLDSAPPFVQNQFRYVGSYQDLMGVRDPAFVFVGTYEIRPDWPLMRDACAQHHRTFPRMLLNQVKVVVKEPCPHEHRTEQDDLDDYIKEEYGNPY